MIEQSLYILMILAALYIVIEGHLKRVIIATGVFSLLAAFCYLLFHAPDVALAEAIIGSTLSTILYIVSLKKYHTFYIFIASRQYKNDFKVRLELRDVYTKIMRYCADHELQAQYVYTWESPETIARDHVCDLIVKPDTSHITIYGLEQELHVANIKKLLQPLDPEVAFVPLKAEQAHEVF